jgi:hypothetical protein
MEITGNVKWSKRTFSGAICKAWNLIRFSGGKPGHFTVRGKPG